MATPRHAAHPVYFPPNQLEMPLFAFAASFSNFASAASIFFMASAPTSFPYASALYNSALPFSTYPPVHQVRVARLVHAAHARTARIVASARGTRRAQLTALSNFWPACAAHFSPSFWASWPRPGISDLIFALARDRSAAHDAVSSVLAPQLRGTCLRPASRRPWGFRQRCRGSSQRCRRPRGR